jgi:hypothetical protein
MSTQCVGKIEYELDANGKRTGRWRPREGSAVASKQGFTAKVPQAWRPGKSGSEPVEAPRK